MKKGTTNESHKEFTNLLEDKEKLHYKQKIATKTQINSSRNYIGFTPKYATTL